jgi:multidrug resistance efflux pump
MKNNRFGIVMITGLVIAAVALALFGPLIFRKKVEKRGPEVRQAANAAVTSKGVVESEEEVQVGSQVSGIIREIRANEGDPVRKGQLLVILDSGKVVAKVEQAEAMTREARERLRELETGSRSEDIEIARARAKRDEVVYGQANDEFQRQERLYRKDAATLIERDRALERMKTAAEELKGAESNLQKLLKGERKGEVEQARAAVARNSAEKKYNQALLREYTITSPIDGVVTARQKEAGEIVDVGTPLMKLINPKRMRIRAEIEETDVGKVKDGQQVEVTMDAYRDKVYRGKVYKIFPDVKRKAQKTFDPMASFDINTQQIYIRLDDFTGLKDGMTVTVRFLK